MSAVVKPAKYEDLGVLNASIQHDFTSIGVRLRFHVGDQIASVLNEDEPLRP
jgi:hypothetical protein